jgi:hypothetical protein
LYQHDKPNEPTKKGALSFVLFEYPFASVSTVSRGHPSLVSLLAPGRQQGTILTLFSPNGARVVTFQVCPFLKKLMQFLQSHIQYNIINIIEEELEHCGQR